MTTLYRLYAADGTLLYVGITDRDWRRMAEHEADKPWWAQVASATFEHHLTRDLAEQAETAAILAEHPVYNVRGNVSPGAATAYGERLQRRAVAEARQLGGGPDYLTGPYTVPCPDCGVLDFEPCVSRGSRLELDRVHGNRAFAYAAAFCGECGQRTGEIR